MLEAALRAYHVGLMMMWEHSQHGTPAVAHELLMSVAIVAMVRIEQVTTIVSDAYVVRRRACDHLRRSMRPPTSAGPCSAIGRSWDRPGRPSGRPSAPPVPRACHGHGAFAGRRPIRGRNRGRCSPEDLAGGHPSARRRGHGRVEPARHLGGIVPFPPDADDPGRAEAWIPALVEALAEAGNSVATREPERR